MMLRMSSLLVVVTAANARADDAPPVRQFLADPTSLAHWLGDHDPQVEAANAKVVAASAQADQAAVFPNPQLSVGIGNFVLGNPNTFSSTMPGPTNPGATTNYTVGIGELVEIGKRGPRNAAANYRLHEAGETRVATLGGRVGDVMGVLGKLAYVVARHEVVQTNLDAATKIEGIEKTRLDNKDISPLDFERIQADKEDLEIQLARADADVAIALAACTTAVFAPCSTAGLDAAALDAGAPLPGAMPDVDTSIAGRPTHRAEVLERTALGEDAQLADHRKIPDPVVSVNYTYDNYQFGGGAPNTFGVAFAIPLPFFDRGNHDAAAARANAHAVDAQTRAEMHQERNQVLALVAQRDALANVLHQLESEAVPRSTKIVAQTRAAYDNGHVSLPDLLLAEREHRDLLLEVLDTRFDLFNVRAQLRQAIGLDDQAARDAGSRP